MICHGDFAPYNSVIRNGDVCGVFDFDTAHPGPRLWGLAYLAYRWVPLTAPSNPDWSTTLAEQSRRLKLLCTAYGTSEMSEVLHQARLRLLAMVDTIRSMAADGHLALQAHLAEGHDKLYLADADYIDQNREQILSAQ